ncbi:hypothetical protein [Verrucomicrobium spinosum]|uniref:hypothetical protein n=1 Tax=Verrucomicrobium spinosum TaxID=2736 RepID=UPI00210B86D8|nr:hypothetical protein [Verrucomicrobium spinosum]
MYSRHLYRQGIFHSGVNSASSLVPGMVGPVIWKSFYVEAVEDARFGIENQGTPLEPARAS